MMARLARVVIPGLPHHVTQRGNRRQAVFFREEDDRADNTLVGAWCANHDVAIWAYCLMTNHIHLILVPRTADGLWNSTPSTPGSCGTLDATRGAVPRRTWRVRMTTS